MKTYTIAKIDKMGDNHAEYGQTWWGEVNEQLEPVMFNLTNQEVKAGDTITAETIELKTSKKGTEYHRLKKVKIQGGAPQEISQPFQAPREGLSEVSNYTESQMNQLLELVKEIHGAVVMQHTPKGDPVFDESGAPIQDYQ